MERNTLQLWQTDLCSPLFTQISSIHTCRIVLGFHILFCEQCVLHKLKTGPVLKFIEWHKKRLYEAEGCWCILKSLTFLQSSLGYFETFCISCRPQTTPKCWYSIIVRLPLDLSLFLPTLAPLRANMSRCLFQRGECTADTDFGGSLSLHTCGA